MRYKLTVEYDGNFFLGYQRQPGKLTVQGEIEDALKKICKEEVTIHSSGRTDRGVHANGQVFHFDTHLENVDWYNAINTYLDKHIRVLQVEVVSEDFHSRYSVKKKEYKFSFTYDDTVFKRNYKTYLKYQYDHKLIQEALKLFVGRHDFRSFASCSEDDETIREIYEINFVEQNDGFDIYFVGNGFMTYMIRMIAGSVLDVARGKKDISEISYRLNNPNNTIPKVKAEPNGLYLNKVYY